MPSIEEVVGRIADANNRGVDAFEVEVGDHQVAYRLFGQLDGARLTVHADPPMAFKPRAVGASLLDATPERVVKKTSRKPRAGEIAIDRHRELPIDARVRCANGTARLVAVFSIWVREYGIKELDLEARELHADDGSKLEQELVAMGVRRRHGGFQVAGELGILPRLRVESVPGGFTVKLERIELERCKRPRRDPHYRVVSSTRGPDRTFWIHQLDPALPTSKILETLRSSTDPFVAAAAAYVAGQTRLEAVAASLQRCARDPLEHENVRTTCLWALAQLDA